jgi:hypothetical protein
MIKSQLRKLDSKGDPENLPQGKKRKSKNSLAFDLRRELYRMCGVDLTRIDGMDENSVLKVLSETGIDMSAWPTGGAATIRDKSDIFLGHVVVLINIKFLNSCFKTAVIRRLLSFLGSFDLMGTLFWAKTSLLTHFRSHSLWQQFTIPLTQDWPAHSARLS